METCVTTCTLKHVCVCARITELMSDFPHVDSVMGCGLEPSDGTSGQVGQQKGLLVALPPSLLSSWHISLSCAPL